MSRSFVSLSTHALTVGVGPRILISQLDLVISSGTRLGLVGPNGSGKSTLLRTLAGLHQPESGRISLAPGDAVVGYWPQESRPVPGETVRGLLHRRTGVAAAQHDLDRATQALAVAADRPSQQQPDPDDEYAQALDHWLTLGGADIEVRAEVVMADLGLPERLLDQEVITLSGGQATRTHLAALLLARFDVFLLDEPTNNLDLDGLEQLEQFVASLDAPMVVVSHDREFLGRTVTAVAEIQEHTPEVIRFDGGWQAYLDERANAHQRAADSHQAYMAERDALAEQARRQRQWADKGVRNVKRSGETDKFIKHRHSQSAQRRAAKAKQTEGALARLNPVEKPWEGWELRMTVANAGRSGNEVATLTDAVVELPPPDGAQRGFRLGPVNLRIDRGDRIAVLGPNGSGKSTLLRALLGRVPLAAGERRLGVSVVVGEIGQQRDDFSGSPDLLHGFIGLTGLRQESEARSVLAKFGLGAEQALQEPGSLSPGERTRASLAALQARGVNLLVLDEPTNHLDLPAIEQLEEAVGSYDGTLILVSHDRQLVDAIKCQRVVEVAEGVVRERR